jgi:hypothetical protein
MVCTFSWKAMESEQRAAMLPPPVRGHAAENAGANQEQGSSKKSGKKYRQRQPSPPDEGNIGAAVTGVHQACADTAPRAAEARYHQAVSGSKSGAP